MPFGRFLREAEPSKTYRCSRCHVDLKRRRSVWWLLGVGAAFLATAVGAGVPVAFERWGIAVSVVFVLVATAAGVLGLKVCGWLFVGWDPTGTDGRARS